MQSEYSNSKHVDVWHVSWTAVRLAVQKLCKILPPTPVLYGVSYGGIIPAALLARPKAMHASVHIMGVARRRHGQITPDAASRRRVADYPCGIIVDDIADSGDTLDTLNRETGKLTAALFYRQGGKKPYYYGVRITSKAWLVFPWEEEWNSETSTPIPPR